MTIPAVSSTTMAATTSASEPVVSSAPSFSSSASSLSSAPVVGKKAEGKRDDDEGKREDESAPVAAAPMSIAQVVRAQNAMAVTRRFLINEDLTSIQMYLDAVKEAEGKTDVVTVAKLATKHGLVAQHLFDVLNALAQVKREFANPSHDRFGEIAAQNNLTADLLKKFIPNS